MEKKKRKSERKKREKERDECELQDCLVEGKVTRESDCCKVPVVVSSAVEWSSLAVLCPPICLVEESGSLHGTVVRVQVTSGKQWSGAGSCSDTHQETLRVQEKDNSPWR